MIKCLPFQCALSSSDLGFREITSGTLIEVRRLSRAAICNKIDLTVLSNFSNLFFFLQQQPQTLHSHAISNLN